MLISAETNTTLRSLICFRDHFQRYFCESKMEDTSVFYVEETLVAAVWVHERPHAGKGGGGQKT